jgi:hypothetical protein
MLAELERNHTTVRSDPAIAGPCSLQSSGTNVKKDEEFGKIQLNTGCDANG